MRNTTMRLTVVDECMDGDGDDDDGDSWTSHPGEDLMMTSSGLMTPSDPLSETNDTQTHTYIMGSCYSIDLPCHLC